MTAAGGGVELLGSVLMPGDEAGGLASARSCGGEERRDCGHAASEADDSATGGATTDTEQAACVPPCDCISGPPCRPRMRWGVGEAAPELERACPSSPLAVRPAPSNDARNVALQDDRSAPCWRPRAQIASLPPRGPSRTCPASSSAAAAAPSRALVPLPDYGVQPRSQRVVGGGRGKGWSRRSKRHHPKLQPQRHDPPTPHIVARAHTQPHTPPALYTSSPTTSLASHTPASPLPSPTCALTQVEREA